MKDSQANSKTTYCLTRIVKSKYVEKKATGKGEPTQRIINSSINTNVQEIIQRITFT